MEAALAASAKGLSTLLLDEQDQAGGQYFRSLASAVGNPRMASRSQFEAGNVLRARLNQSGVEAAFQRKVWNARTHTTPESRFLIDTVGAAGLESWTSRSLILATGATERIIPFNGWTVPGVMGLAGASILLKAHQMLPGRRTVVAGSGPLLAMVAASIIKGGGEVAAIVDAMGVRDWLSSMPGFLTRPDQLRLGGSWLSTIMRAGVPILSKHAVITVEGDDRIEKIIVKPLDSNGRVQKETASRSFSVDSLVVGYGLVPATELSRLLGIRLEFRVNAGGWVPEINDQLGTSLPGLFVAGDCAGIAGALPAQLRGRLAGLSAARYLSARHDLKTDAANAKARKTLNLAERFGRASARLMAFPAGLAESLALDTVVCRCEGVTLLQVDAALDEGASELNQLKTWTGCAMGTCQGRYCSEFLEWRLRRRSAKLPASGALHARPPVRSLPVEQLIGADDGKPLNLPQKRP